MDMKPAMQFSGTGLGGTVVVRSMGQSAMSKSEPAKPPTRTCTSQSDEGLLSVDGEDGGEGG